MASGPVTNPEIIEYFEARRERLEIVTTTRTPSGQLLDWVPAESQLREGSLAEPPPREADAREPEGPLPDGVDEPDRPVEFELDDPAAERGPAGTVPIARVDFSAQPITVSLPEYLAKYGKRSKRGRARGDNPPAIDLHGYFHASSWQPTTCYGAETALNVWAPAIENEGDHSLMQLGLLNHDLAKLQSIEAGWQVGKQHYGDWHPHLFVYYTTNGYEKDDDDVGGYNQDVEGWVQVDDVIFPGARLGPVSERGSGQWAIAMKVQLHASNWWIKVNDRWVGYYPASLFMGNESVFGTLGDHADLLGFWGEVYTDDSDPNATRTDMGSGSYGGAGWRQSCYQRNLRVQTRRDGTMEDHAGAPSAENTDYYDIDSHMGSPTSWASHFFAGGPGCEGWKRWFPIRPELKVSPGAKVTALWRSNETHLDLFTTSADGTVWSTFWERGKPSWEPWFAVRPESKAHPGAPVTALWRSGETHLDLFMTGADGTVWSTWWEKGPGWQPWFPIKPEVKMKPGAEVTALWRSKETHLDLFATSADGTVWSTLWEPQRQWAPWFPVRPETKVAPGAKVTALWRSKETHLDLFAAGADGTVWSTLWEPQRQWAPWFPVRPEAKVAPGAPIAALWRSRETHLDLFASGPDGAVVSSLWEAALAWQPWFPIHAETKMQPGAQVTALWRSPEKGFDLTSLWRPHETHLDLFATSTDGTVWSTLWEPQRQWAPWFPIHGEVKMQPGAPITALWRSFESHLDLFTTSADGTVWSTWWGY